MFRRRSLSVTHLLPLLLVFGGLTLDATAQEGTKKAEAKKKEKPIPLTRQAYRVRVSLAFGPSNRFDEMLQSRIAGGIATGVDRTFGAVWNEELVANDWLYPRTSGRLARLTTEAALERFGVELERVAVVLLTERGGEFTAHVRIWDESTRSWGEVAHESAYGADAITSAATRLLAKQFRPTIEMEQSDGLAFSAFVKGSELRPADPDFALVRKGDVLTPYFRYLDKEQTVQRQQPVPLTFLLVDEVTPDRVTGRQVSGLRVALTGRRRRVITGATVQPVNHPTTDLLFVAQGNEDKAIAGYEVKVHAKTMVREKAETDPLIVVTDRSGKLTLERNPEQPVVWIYVHSASALLARIPYVPGIAAREVVAVPDDTERLSVEGKLRILETELVDSVAERTILMLRAKKAADAEKWKDVDKYLGELNEQLRRKGMSYFQGRLRTIRQTALAGTTDRLITSRIKRLSSKTEAIMNKHLDETAVNKIKSEIQELRP